MNTVLPSLRDSSKWALLRGQRLAESVRGCAVRALAACGLVALSLALAGCGTTGSALEVVGAAAGKALELAGLKRPEAPALPDAQLPARKVAVNLHASQSLNVDARNQSLALVVRVYQLRRPEGFLSLSQEVLSNPQLERERLGADLVEVRDVQLVPGQRLALQEKLPREAAVIGIVGLFRAPAGDRWRLAFSSEAAERTGLVLGAHACALSVSQGEPLGAGGGAPIPAATFCP
jgi:type VI secretion system protein VasD